MGNRRTWPQLSSANKSVTSSGTAITVGAKLRTEETPAATRRKVQSPVPGAVKVWAPPPATEQLTEADRSPLYANGTFIHANPSDPIHYGKGRVSVYERTVFLESDFEVGPGPKFHVYLVPKANIRANSDVPGTMFIDLGRLRAFQGSQRYAIPAGVDLKKLSRAGVELFFTQVFRDGFFHADMHPGNLFVDHEGRIVAVDFGIMGRLSPKERRFLAEILYGFITRDYYRTAEVHFEAGYVPRHHSVEDFAQAIRAIGDGYKPRVVFTSSIAVFGAPFPDAIDDEHAIFADPFSVSLLSITRHPPPAGGRAGIDLVSDRAAGRPPSAAASACLIAAVNPSPLAAWLDVPPAPLASNSRLTRAVSSAKTSLLRRAS